MKILYFHQYFKTPDMSGGTRSFEMARRLVMWGHEVYMITASCDGKDKKKRIEDIEGIKVCWLPVSYSNNMKFWSRILAFIKFAVFSAKEGTVIKPDVVFATSTPLTIALPGVFASKFHKVPMVFEVRDLWPEVPIAIGAIKNKFAKKLAYWLERFAYKNSKKIVALSPGMKEGILKTGYPGERVKVIPNSSDIEMFQVPPNEGIKFREKFDWLQKRPLVVYLGTLGKINGIEYFVKLAKKVEAIDPEVRFLAIGKGCEEKKIKEKAKSLGVLNKNFFLFPSIPKNDIPAVLSAADMATSFVIPVSNLWANSANKFFDALASGTPVAINHEGWLAELLREHNCGVVLDANDIDKAVSEMLEHLLDKDWLRNARKEALDLAKNKFSRDKLAKELEELLIETYEKKI